MSTRYQVKEIRTSQGWHLFYNGFDESVSKARKENRNDMGKATTTDRRDFSLIGIDRSSTRICN